MGRVKGMEPPGNGRSALGENIGTDKYQHQARHEPYDIHYHDSTILYRQTKIHINRFARKPANNEISLRTTAPPEAYFCI